MNVSGTKLLHAWKAFVSAQDPDSLTALVVLHDELESAPGTLKIKRGSGSHKGHNGIKSIYASFSTGGVLAQLGDKRFMKLGIGIGRPQSRGTGDVSGYVLGQLPAGEKKALENNAGEIHSMLQAEIDTLASEAA
jgi:peptidyl-tRNA hydrolase, PTH1 family